MAVEITQFSPARRKTTYPYARWFQGRMLRLKRLEDFNGKPTAVVESVVAYARRNDIAAVAFPVRDENGDSVFVELWGDPARSWKEGPPPEIVEELERSGRPYHRQRVGSSVG